MTQIIPAVLAKNLKELRFQLSKVRWAEKVQIDVADGVFVNAKTLNFAVLKKHLPEMRIQLHLMVVDPEKYITALADEIIFHVETGKDIIDKLKSRKIIPGIAFNPETDVNDYKCLIKKARIAQVMTVKPGRMGGKFLKSQLKKVQQIKKINPRIKIGIDGGINSRTIRFVKQKPDFIVVGSALQRAENPEKEFLFLLNKC